jgi:hypothetical protein
MAAVAPSKLCAWSRGGFARRMLDSLPEREGLGAAATFSDYPSWKRVMKDGKDARERISNAVG